MKEIPGNSIIEKKEKGDDQNAAQGNNDGETEHRDVIRETSRMLFLMLGLDLPPPPLFKDVMEKNIIPQVLHAFFVARIYILGMISDILLFNF